MIKKILLLPLLVLTLVVPTMALDKVHTSFFTNCGTSITTAEGSITIADLDAPNKIVKVFNEHWTTVYNCSEKCDNVIEVADLTTGTYYIRIDTYNSSWERICDSGIIEIEVIGSNGEGSATTGYCTSVAASGGVASIRIDGVDGPWHRIQYKPEGATDYIEACNDNCSNPFIIDNLPSGTYMIKIDQADTGGGNYCIVNFAITVDDDASDSCAGVSAIGGAGNITVTGVNAPWHRISYKTADASDYIEACNDNCTNPFLISDLAAGSYSLKIEQNNNNNEIYNYCTSIFDLTVTDISSDGATDSSDNTSEGDTTEGDVTDGNNSNETLERYTGPVSTDNACAIRAATNTNSCAFDNYGIYLNTYTEGVNIFYDIIESQFVEYEDGTARFTGTMVNRNNLWIRLLIDVTFHGRTSVTPTGSPKEHTCDIEQDVDSFYYYTSYLGTITGTEQAEGALLTIASNGPAFQLGYGANVTERQNPQPFGASGWFTVEVVQQANDFTFNFPEDPAGQVGDINITLSGEATACFESPITSEMTVDTRKATFTTFNAFAYQRHIDVEWTTNQVVESDYYILEKSIDGQNFSQIERIQENKTTAELSYFKIKDLTPAKGKNYYRLHQYYKDGTSQYSGIQVIDFGVDLNEFSIFPNPVQNEFFINLSAHAGEQVQIMIANQFGRVVKQVALEKIPAAPIAIDFKDVENGLYIVRTRVGIAGWNSKKVMVSKLY